MIMDWREAAAGYLIYALVLTSLIMMIFTAFVFWFMQDKVNAAANDHVDPRFATRTAARRRHRIRISIPQISFFGIRKPQVKCC